MATIAALTSRRANGPTAPLSRQVYWLTGLTALVCLLAADKAQQPRAFHRAVIIPIEGEIDPMLEQFLKRRLSTAKELKADLVILQIDSPGGLLDESLRMAHHLRSLDWAYTVAYIPREALSGAAILALGCDEIIMHPTALMGDAGPIFLNEGFMFEHAPEKIVSHLAAQVRTLAEGGNRPPALAEAMVDRNLEVYEYRNRRTEARAFMSAAEIASAKDEEDWERGALVHESRKGSFLEVNGQRAVELGLAEASVDDLAGLKARYRQTDDLTVLAHTWVDSTVGFLNRTWVTVLLFLIGLVCVYVEFSSPGTMIGGLLALLCFALFFWSRALGGTADWLDILLFVVGAVFLAVELFLLPGFGFAGFVGGLLILVSIIMASQRVVFSEYGVRLDLATLLTTLSVIVGSGVAGLGATLILRRYFGLIPAMSNLVLAPPTTSTAEDASAAETAWRQSLPGQLGTTRTPLRPAGRATIGERELDVIADGGYIPAGAHVRVIEVTGNRVLVVEA